MSDHRRLSIRGCRAAVRVARDGSSCRTCTLRVDPATGKLLSMVRIYATWTTKKPMVCRDARAARPLLDACVRHEGCPSLCFGVLPNEIVHESDPQRVDTKRAESNLCPLEHRQVGAGPRGRRLSAGERSPGTRRGCKQRLRGTHRRRRRSPAWRPDRQSGALASACIGRRRRLARSRSSRVRCGNLSPRRGDAVGRRRRPPR